jgi:hypothetical protein
MCKGDMSSECFAGMRGGYGAAEAKGSWDIGVDVGDCRERAYIVDKGSVHGPTWPRGEPRCIVMWLRLPMYLDLAERMVVWCSWKQSPKLIFFSGTADLSGCSRRMCHWCSFNLVVIGPPSCPMLYASGVFSHRSPLTDRSELDIFLGGKPTDLMLCRDSTILIGRISIRHTAGKRLNLAFRRTRQFSWRAEGPENLPVGVKVLPENVPQKNQT